MSSKEITNHSLEDCFDPETRPASEAKALFMRFHSPVIELTVNDRLMILIICSYP
jgi:hypothetical protein